MEENKNTQGFLEDSEDEELEVSQDNKWYIDLCEEEPEIVVKEYDITATPNDFNILTLFSLIRVSSGCHLSTRYSSYIRCFKFAV